MAFRILKTFTLSWWRLGIFKFGLLALGVAAGAHWHGLVVPYAPWLALAALIALAYIVVVWWKQ